VKKGTDDKLYYAYTDHLGNVVAWTNASGGMVGSSLARYEPFGTYRTKPASSVNPDISDRGFTGHRQNNTGAYDLGLTYMNARYYLPEIGRFISADTIVPEPGNPQSFNRYSYGFNNPVKYTDPSGHIACPHVLNSNVCSISQDFDSTVEVLKVDTPRVQPAPSDNDQTEWLIYQISQAPNSEGFQDIQEMWRDGNLVGASILWAGYVWTGSVWDFKPDLLDAGVPDKESNVVLGGMDVNFQAIANVFFGYVGRDIGMGEMYLQFGAGVAQVEHGVDHWLANFLAYPQGWGDQAFDAWSIGFGFYLYDLYGHDPSLLTPESLADALREYNQTNPKPELK